MSVDLTTLAERPSHVPERLVYEFDFLNDPDLQDDAPMRVLEIVDDAPPVFWTPHNGGHCISRATRSYRRAFVPTPA